MEGYTEWRNWWWWYISTWRVLGLVKTPVRHESLSVGPQVGFRPHGSRAPPAAQSSRPRCIYLRIGRILPLSFSSTRLVYTRPLSFVRKKARLHARQKKKRIHLPRCTTCLIWAARGSLRQDYRPITLSLSKQDGPGRPVCGLLWCHTRVSQTTGRGIHDPELHRMFETVHIRGR